jgi:ribosomal protein L11 methyltransferase
MSTARVLVVSAAPGEAEVVADRLWAAGANAVSMADAVDGAVELRAGFDRDADLDAARRELGGRIDQVDDGTHAWRAFARSMLVADRLLVRPAWLPHQPASLRQPMGRRGDAGSGVGGSGVGGSGVGGSGVVEVVIDPGRSYGMGDHPSTRLALELLVAHMGPGDRVLDVGCGSGILGVAALKLGAATATAIDVEPAAAEDTLENARRNGVEVAASTTPLRDVRGDFDLVLANLGGSAVVVELAHDLAAKVRGAGRLVVSGLLAELAAPALDALETEGLHAIERRSEDGWLAAALAR